jgi:hypothetical protein
MAFDGSYNIFEGWPSRSRRGDGKGRLATLYKEWISGEFTENSPLDSKVTVRICKVRWIHGEFTANSEFTGNSPLISRDAPCGESALPRSTIYYTLEQ